MKQNYIQKLTLRNFQGFNSEHELAALTILTGVPASGKTTIVAGMHLLLTGYIPGVSKKAGDIFAECATGSEMYIAGETSRGDLLERKWIKSNDKVSTAARLNKVKTDGAPFVPSVMLDAREYLGLSDRERTKTLFTYLDLSALKCDADTVCARMKAIKVEAPTKESEAAIETVCDGIRKLFRERKPDQTFQEWLSSLSPLLKERTSNARAGVQQMKQANEALAASEVVEPVSPTIERDIAQARKQLGENIGAIATLTQRMNSARSQKARKELLQGVPCVDHSEKILKLSREAKRLGDEFLSYNHKAPVIQSELEGLRRDKRNAETMIRDTSELIGEREKEFGALIKKGKCPTCGDDDCKGLEKRAKKLLDAATETPRENLKGYEKKLAETVKAIGVKEKAFTAAKAEDDAADEKKRAADQARNELNKLQREQSAYDQQQAELKGIGEIADETELQREREEKESEKTACETRITDLSAKQRQAIAAKARAAQMDANNETLKRYEAELEVLKLAEKEVEAELGEVIKQTVGPLIKRANGFVSKLMRTPLVYESGEFGYWRGENFVTHRRFSGWQRAVAFTAISMALVPKSEMRVVYVDELGVMPARYRAKMYDAIVDELNSGALHQFIGIDCHASDYLPGGALAFKPHGDLCKVISLPEIEAAA